MEIAEELCRRVAEEGLSIKKVCEADDMPAERTVFQWLNKYPEFAQLYARAREQRADAIFEEVLTMADECPLDKEAAAAYRLRIDARKWAAAKLNTVRYGDRQQVDLNATVRNIPDDQLDARLAKLLGKAGVAGTPRGEGVADEAEQASDL